MEKVLNSSEPNDDLRIEGRDEAMLMLATVYCKQRKFRAVDKMIRENDFRGKDKAIKLLLGIYCHCNMWEEAEKLVIHDFEGRDAALKALAEEFYSQRK